MNRILLTGISGFIGRNVANALLGRKHEITALVRPGTDTARIGQFQDKVHFDEVDLGNPEALRNYLKDRTFDTIVHIGALRGGRKASRKVFWNVNVLATEQLLDSAFRKGTRFIHCSSVGIFGAIPDELPANNESPRKEDNLYHTTKIRAEVMAQKYFLEGLNGAIIRPAITYGPGDYGFPFTLVKLIDKNLFRLPTAPVRIHLTHIDLLAQAFVKAVETDWQISPALNVADSTPVLLSDLADMICERLRGRKYPHCRRIDPIWFRIGERMARLVGNELWVSRFELISKNWYYDVEDTYKILGLHSVKTLNEFRVVVDWYKKLNGMG